MSKRRTGPQCPERPKLGFEEKAAQAFSFLERMGFLKIEASPTHVRYSADDLSATVYHGRQSYEIGFDITRERTTYSLSEIIRLANPDLSNLYRRSAATTPAAVFSALQSMKELVTQYAAKALQGDSETFQSLDEQRREMAYRLGLETEISAVKPRADEAFRRGDYALAAELFDRIRSGLTPAEAKKADLARKRASGEL